MTNSRKVQTDVDIDVYGRDEILDGIEHICARLDQGNRKREKHPSGVYFQNIPRDPTTNISTIDYKVAGEYGYFKIDFLNVNMYEGIRNEEHLISLLNKEPDWDLFQYSEITDQLFHLKGYHKLLQKYKPKSVEDLAMILAIIRPAKAYLQQADWDQIRKEVWTKVGDENYQFKKSHSISYALAIVVNLNLLIEQTTV